MMNEPELRSSFKLTPASLEVRIEAKTVLGITGVLKRELCSFLIALAKDIQFVERSFRGNGPQEQLAALRKALHNRLLELLPDDKAPHPVDLRRLRQRRSMLLGCLVHIVASGMEIATLEDELKNGGVRGFYDRVPKIQKHPVQHRKTKVIVEPKVRDHCQQNDGEDVVLLGRIAGETLTIYGVATDHVERIASEVTTSSHHFLRLPKPDKMES